jgi:hypothetical protein
MATPIFSLGKLQGMTDLLPGKQPPSVRRIGACVGPGSSKDALENRNVFYTNQKENPGSLVAQQDTEIPRN